MGTPVLILGSSGKGKSTSLRNLDPAKCVLIQALDKPLPFPAGKKWDMWDKETSPDGSRFVTDNADEIGTILKSTKKRDIIIIDDFQYVLINEFMRRSKETGFGKFNDIAYNAWFLLRTAASLGSNKRVYFMWHEDIEDSGNVKAKTVGKLLDDKLPPEGMVTVCLRARKSAERHYFQTQSEGMDPCKSPMGMFDSGGIDNDLKFVDDTICTYYDIK